VPPGNNQVLEFSFTGLADQDVLGLRKFCGRLGYVPRYPCGDYARGIRGILRSRQQVVGIVERDEALGVPCGKKDARGIVDPDHLVARGMQYKQRPAERADLVVEPPHLGVLDERAPNAERPAGQLDFGLAFGPDPIERTAELPEHVRHIGRRADRHDGLRLGNAFGRRQHGGSAERMADEYDGCLVVAPQVVGGADEILDVGGEVGIGEVALR